MDKNVLIAFLVSTVVIMGYYFLFPPQNRNTQVAEPNPKIQAELKQTKEFPTIAEKKLAFPDFLDAFTKIFGSSQAKKKNTKGKKNFFSPFLKSS